ncbi:putative transposase B (plasmid) [Ochrobactrum quorumnocens]|uniref:Putative transposase B n=1 Tax=Ochrobactrum quorumnocens TaxID=271865 RepID=A0A248UMV6_9HYPH|nr:putative transposase B [[Ochrobactrum] quorumnocens]
MADMDIAASGGLDRERQTGRADMATGRAEGSLQATKARLALAERQLLH